MQIPSFIHRDVDLARRTTLALPGHAAFLATLTESGQLPELASFARARGLRRFVLGGGSNVVVQGDFDGLVVHMKNAGCELVGQDADARYVRAAAGENWDDFVAYTLAQGWAGLENLTLIPGKVGAAPIQNVGAYGLELSERFHSLSAFDFETGETRVFDRAACAFAYRDSVFKRSGWHLEGRLVITDVTFRLPRLWQPLTSYADLAAELEARGSVAPTAQQIASAVAAVRERKLPDPKVIGNAGSFFHNPIVAPLFAVQLAADHPGLPCYSQPDGRVKIAAGWMIEKAGWKGRELGAVGMYEKQALVLVNHGEATGDEVIALMQAVQRDVREKFGVSLEPEPVFL